MVVVRATALGVAPVQFGRPDNPTAASTRIAAAGRAGGWADRPAPANPRAGLQATPLPLTVAPGTWLRSCRLDVNRDGKTDVASAVAVGTLAPSAASAEEAAPAAQ